MHGYFHQSAMKQNSLHHCCAEWCILKIFRSYIGPDYFTHLYFPTASCPLLSTSEIVYFKFAPTPYTPYRNNLL